MKPHAPRFALALAVVPALLAASCRSTAELPAGEPLPFHLALIPTEIHDTSRLAHGGSTSDLAPPGSDDDMRLELRSGDVSGVLRDELGRAFVRTTLLAAEDEGALAALGPAEREQYWQARAREIGADVLLRTRLLYDPRIDGRRNEKFWLNLPLFVLGGPFCYFVGDRSYHTSARLQAEALDISESHESLDDYALLAIPLHVEFQGLDLPFLERASGVGDYALSLLVPTGLLARETAAIESALQEELPIRLGRELARKVLGERSQFEQNSALGAFALEADAAQFEPRDSGRVRVRVPVRALGEPSRLHRFELHAGGNLLSSGDFPASTRGRGLIDTELVLPAGTEYLTVRVTDATANTRSYTLRLGPLAP